MRFCLAFSAAALILVLAGCSSSRESSSAFRPTKVEVSNNNFHDVNLFIVRGSQRVRLGFIQSNATRVLDIPTYIASAGGLVLFVADPIGSNRRPFSQEFYIEEGQTLQLIIPAI